SRVDFSWIPLSPSLSPLVPRGEREKPDTAALHLRACFKIQRGPVFAEKAAWRGATKEHSLEGSVTEEQRSQAAFSAKTRRAAGLLAAAGVGSALTARCGDARASPPWLRPKSLAAGPLSILKQALSWRPAFEAEIFFVSAKSDDPALFFSLQLQPQVLDA